MKPFEGPLEIRGVTRAPHDHMKSIYLDKNRRTMPVLQGSSEDYKGPYAKDPTIRRAAKFLHNPPSVKQRCHPSRAQRRSAVFLRTVARGLR